MAMNILVFRSHYNYKSFFVFLPHEYQKLHDFITQTITNKIKKKILLIDFFPVLLFYARIDINNHFMNNVYNDYAVTR